MPVEGPRIASAGFQPDMDCPPSEAPAGPPAVTSGQESPLAGVLGSGSVPVAHGAGRAVCFDGGSALAAVEGVLRSQHSRAEGCIAHGGVLLLQALPQLNLGIGGTHGMGPLVRVS